MGDMQQKAPNAWVWEATAETERQPKAETVDVSFEDLGEVCEPVNGCDAVMQATADSGKHTIPPDIFDVQPHSTGHVCPAELDDGVKFAELYGELRRVREEQDHKKTHGTELVKGWREEIARHKDTQQQLKIMTEGRDEYRELYVDCAARFDALDRKMRRAAILERNSDEIHSSLKYATSDELTLVRRIVTKLMGEGRREYGPFCVATETRTAEELEEEAADELADGMVYTAMAAMVRGRDA